LCTFYKELASICCRCLLLAGNQQAPAFRHPPREPFPGFFYPSCSPGYAVHSKVGLAKHGLLELREDSELTNELLHYFDPELDGEGASVENVIAVLKGHEEVLSATHALSDTIALLVSDDPLAKTRFAASHTLAKTRFAASHVLNTNCLTL
jgi:hypothetical protein